MEKAAAKKRLQQFIGNTVLTFSIRTLDSGEWIAECNEIPGLATGGAWSDISNMDEMIRDAILTAARVDVAHDDLLRFANFEEVRASRSTLGRLTGRNDVGVTRSNTAEYALSA